MAPGGRGRRKDYAPVGWQRYYAQAQDVETAAGSFRAYLTQAPEPPHDLRVVTLHGGGYSGLSWALFTEELVSELHCQVVSLDLRGHGETHAHNDKDLSGETLANDVAEVLLRLLGEETPPLVLVGHSMGGAVAVRAAAHAQLVHAVRGVAVIDVVEGTAMESLASMQSFLRSRPTHFRSMEHAIEWCIRSGQVRNVDSAKVSMPSQIVNCATGRLAASELEEHEPPAADAEAEPSRRRAPLAANVIEEADESDQSSEECSEVQKEQEPVFKPPGEVSCAPSDAGYRWRIDLSKTEEYWPGWFSGLSGAFLALPAPRLLLLASIDGLDRELTVGQMQGKFQMQVLPRCGHAVHEDRPAEVARAVAAFAARHRLAAAAGSGEHPLHALPGC